jgi:predicted PurR-regulated permease PerM
MILTAIVVVIGGMMHARAVLIPFMMAVFIAIILNGPKAWLEDKGVPKGVALAAVLLGFGALGAAVFLIVGSSAEDFIHNIPTYEKKIHQQTEHLSAFLNSKGIHAGGKGITAVLNTKAALKLSGELVSGLGNLAAKSFVILMLVIFMLSEATGLPAKIREIYGGGERIIHQLQQFSASVKHYMIIKTLVSLATGGLATLCLLIIGVDYPVLWGMLAFGFNFVPNIGSIIAAVPPVLLAMVQLGPGQALVVAGCYLVINLVIGNVVEPRYMGRGLKLSTLVVFLSLLIWGWVLGPVGMLLSVLLTMKLKIMLECNEETRWIALLLGPNKE